MVAAIEQGFPQREIHRSAYAYQQAVERKEKIITGVNEFTAHDEKPVATLVIGEGAAARQKQALAELKQRRNQARVQSTLEALAGAAATTGNLMPYFLKCIRAEATLGEMCDVLRRAFGTYEEPPFG